MRSNPGDWPDYQSAAPGFCVFAHIHKCIITSALNASNSAFNDTLDAALQARIGAVVDDLRIEIANDQLVLFGSVAIYYQIGHRWGHWASLASLGEGGLGIAGEASLGTQHRWGGRFIVDTEWCFDGIFD